MDKLHDTARRHDGDDGDADDNADADDAYIFTSCGSRILSDGHKICKHVPSYTSRAAAICIHTYHIHYIVTFLQKYGSYFSFTTTINHSQASPM